MFDQSAPIQSSGVNPSQPNQNLPNTATPPPVRPEESPPRASATAAEPEDIFGGSQANVSSAPTPLSATAAANNEPAIRNTPSIFTPKEAAPAPIPALDDRGEFKPRPNIIFPISMVVVLIIIGAGSYWWFFARSENSTSNTINNPTVSDFYQNMPENTNNTPVAIAPIDSKPAAVEPKPIIPAQPRDTDGDGLSDEEEIMLGTDLNNPDTDGDGLFDLEEVRVYKTDPLKSDTDGDGISDGEEIMAGTDPLVADNESVDSAYVNNNLKFSFLPLSGMVLEGAMNNLVQFNDNGAQIKFYVYVNNSQAGSFNPDIFYTAAEKADGSLLINKIESRPDQTPNSTEYNTNALVAANGNVYLIRYVATLRSPDHQRQFETILSSFKFLP